MRCATRHGWTPIRVINFWLTSAMRSFSETELSAHTDSHAMMPQSHKLADRWRDADESQSDFRSIRVLQRSHGANEQASSCRNHMESDHEDTVVARQAVLIRLRSRPDDFSPWFCCRHSLAVLWRRGQKSDRWMVTTPCLAGTGTRALWRFCRAVQSGVTRPRIGAAKPRQALYRD